MKTTKTNALVAGATAFPIDASNKKEVTTMTQNYTIQQLNDFLATVSPFELSADQARQDADMRDDGKDWKDTAGFMDEYYPKSATELTNPAIEIKKTPSRKNATPVYYIEDATDTVNHDLYNGYGYLDVRSVGVKRFATEFGLTSDLPTNTKALLADRCAMKQLSKACFHANRSTRVIVFLLSSLNDNTMKQIFNAVVNGKTVHVRYKNLTYKALRLNSSEYSELSQLFADAKKERRNKYLQQRKIAMIEYKNTTLKAHILNENRYVVATTLAQLWELDPVNDDYGYNLLMETIKHYFKAKIEVTRAITVDSDMFEKVIALPLQVQEQLIPLLQIDIVETEYFGNEDYFEMEAL